MVIRGVISVLIRVIRIVTLVITTHEPPSGGGFRVYHESLKGEGARFTRGCASGELFRA